MGTVNVENTEHPLLITSLIASGAVSTRRFVTANGAQCTRKGQRAIGVSKDAAANGYSFGVETEGTALVDAGEVLASDTPVTTDANGKAVAAVAGDWVSGITCAAQATSGEAVEIDVCAAEGWRKWATTSTTTTSTTSSTSSTTSTTSSTSTTTSTSSTTSSTSTTTSTTN